MQISNEVQSGFAQIMGPCLRICKGRKVFSSIACIKLQCDRFCFSGSKQCSLKVVNIQITWECHFTLFKNLSSALGLLVMHINVFFFLMEQYGEFMNYYTWNYSKTIQNFTKYLIRKIFFIVFIHLLIYLITIVHIKSILGTFSGW